jgi:8-oxo-dGTP pyrophosphatase MutT (NUDIX family)
MNKPVAPAVPSATILLLRGDHSALEVFMVVRHHQIDFASGALVFPGGKVDPQDTDPAVAERCDGAADDASTRAIQIAAIREAYEECGVLLARPAGSSQLISGAQLAPLDCLRMEIQSGAVGFLEFLRTHDLRLACDQLVPFAHWITPEMMPKRFDTHFFVADAPVDQVALHDGHESVDSVWITPQAALAGASDGRYTVIFPTLRQIEKLAHSVSPRAAIERARASHVVTVTPWTENRADGAYLCIPADAGYDISEEKMPPRSARP